MSNESGPAAPTEHPAEPTNPEFVVDWQTTPDGQSHGVPQGQDIVIRNKEGGSDYMFYGLLEEIDPPSPKLISVAWDGFNTGLPKEGILVIHTLKSITVQLPDGTPQQVDTYLPKGHYRIVLRDDPTPNGEILGETDDFFIF